MQTAQTFSPNLRKIIIGLCILAIAISVRRALSITMHTGDSPRQLTANFFNEQKFIDHSLLTMAHVLFSCVFIVLALLQFSDHIRRIRPAIHRTAGKVAIAAGIISGTTGIAMAFVMPSGGIIETSAMLCFGSIFIASLLLGYRSARSRQSMAHLNWMVRAFAIASAIVTIRLIVLLFFATKDITGLSFQHFFGLAQWLGFSLHLVLAEWWIRKGENRKRPPVFH